MCDRIAIMDDGRILKGGVPAALVREEIGSEVVEIRIGREEDARLVGLLSGAIQGRERAGDTLYCYCRDGRECMKRLNELNLPSVLHRPATLEDVFLKLAGRGLIE